MPIPTREYRLNHAYGTARALQTYVSRAVRDGDEELLRQIRAILQDMAQAVANPESDA